MYTRQVCEKLGLSYDGMKNDVARLIAKRNKKEKAERNSAVIREAEGFGDRINPDRIKNVGAAGAEDTIIGILAMYPELIPQVIREGSLGFDNVPVDGSTKMDDALMESIEPFNFAEAVDFRTAYLSGYLADRYDVSSEDSKPRANERIKRSTENAFASTVTGYSTVTPESSSVRFNHGRVKYAFYPVWLLNTTWKGKKYYFAMNGQTGRFVGDLPVDWGAYWKWFGIWTAIFAAGTFLAFLLAHLL